MHRPGRCRNRELPDCVEDAGKVTAGRKFLGSSGTFRLSRVAVARDHEVGDAPDVRLGNPADRLLREALPRVNAQLREPAINETCPPIRALLSAAPALSKPPLCVALGTGTEYHL